jgi:hypothetical protein
MPFKKQQLITKMNLLKMELNTYSLSGLSIAHPTTFSFTNLSNKYTLDKGETVNNYTIKNQYLKVESNTGSESLVKVIGHKENSMSFLQLCKSLNKINNGNIAAIKLYENELILKTNSIKDEKFDIVLFPQKDTINLKQKLNELVHADDKDGMYELYKSFCTFIIRYKEEKIVHGNLTDENIMVALNGEIVLTSFNSHFEEDCKSIHQGFFYNNNFTHPDHKEFLYSNYADDFSLLTIATSIYAFSIMPNLFTSLHCNNMLLFSQRDFKNINKARIFNYLDGLQNTNLSILVFQIKIALLNKTTEINNLVKLVNVNKDKTDATIESMEKEYYEVALESKDEIIDVLKNNYCTQIANNSDHFIVNENLKEEKTFFQKKYLSLKSKSTKSIIGLSAASILLIGFICNIVVNENNTVTAFANLHYSQPLKTDKIVPLTLTQIIYVQQIAPKPTNKELIFTKVNKNIGITKTTEKTKTTNIEKSIEKTKPTVEFKQIAYSK